jgi:gluconolactonase
VARLNADGTKTTLAARFLGKRLNSPNDLVVKSNGDLYFTDRSGAIRARNSISAGFTDSRRARN